jgi:hypothetical protein
MASQSMHGCLNLSRNEEMIQCTGDGRYAGELGMGALVGNAYGACRAKMRRGLQFAHAKDHDIKARQANPEDGGPH